MPRFTHLSASTSWPWRSALRTSALVSVALLALPEAAGADQIDFESGYVVNTALDGQDGWVFWDLVQLDNPADFTPRESTGNTVLECVTTGLTEYYRPVEARDGAVDLVWRWRASSSTASLMFGPADELTQTNNNYASLRVRVQMSNGQWGITGALWETPAEPD